MQDVAALPSKRKSGEQLALAEKMSLTDSIEDLMEQGFHSVNAIAQELGYSRSTIARYKKFADKRYNNIKLDREAIRNLQLKRTYRILEKLRQELESCQTIKEKASMYNQIFHFSQHLALISGLNIETRVNYNDPKKLVITRAHPDAVKTALEEINRYNPS